MLPLIFVYREVSEVPKLKRTVVCPTGCSPDSLLRRNMKLSEDDPFNEIPHTLYFCTKCEWEAAWNWNEGLHSSSLGTAVGVWSVPPDKNNLISLICIHQVHKVCLFSRCNCDCHAGKFLNDYMYGLEMNRWYSLEEGERERCREAAYEKCMSKWRL